MNEEEVEFRIARKAQRGNGIRQIIANTQPEAGIIKTNYSVFLYKLSSETQLNTYQWPKLDMGRHCKSVPQQ